MTEQMKLRGTLEGHGGWVTQIATTSEVPDMILSSSRGTCIIRSLCVTVSFGRTLFPFFEEREKTFFALLFIQRDICKPSMLLAEKYLLGPRCTPSHGVRAYQDRTHVRTVHDTTLASTPPLFLHVW